MIILRPASQRGHVKHGWLDSRHTFSFGSYYDPQHMGISALRVINDDVVAPGAGFATHGHSDMEIISYVKHGSIEHKDSMGHIQHLPAGEFQLMSAGTGVTHSEYNPSQTEPLNFLQIWIVPDQFGIKPGYQQKRFAAAPMQLIASPAGRNSGQNSGQNSGENGALKLQQDARLYQISLAAAESTELAGVSGRTLYLHMVRGDLEIENTKLSEGDGATLTDIDIFDAHSRHGGEALLFDLP
ncbi:MAG: pirin family protein [Gammaproteobacteria bacterium]